MLPRDVLAGTSAAVIGTSMEAMTAREALSNLGAEVADLSGEVEDIVRRVVERADDILVLAMPNRHPRATPKAGLSEWREGAGRDLEVAYAVLTAFGAARAQRGGVVLIMVDPIALLGGPGVSAAAAAQAAVVNLVDSLAVEWAPLDIRINALAVGRFEGKDDAGLPGNVPALRLGEARELAWMVEYLCSPFSAYVTGASVTIDGGDSLKRYLLEPLYEVEEFLATARSGPEPRR